MTADDKPKRYFPRDGDVKRRRCVSCKRLRDCTWEADPYRADVGGDFTRVWECDDCRHESAMDI